MSSTDGFALENAFIGLSFCSVTDKNDCAFSIQEMTTLHLVVNVLSCKSGQVYPEIQSDWEVDQLVKVLALSGLTGKLPKHYRYDDVVNLLLEHLLVQKPFVYALYLKNDSKSDLITNSRTLEIVDRQINIGLYANLRLLHSTKCEHVWDAFTKTMGSQDRFIIDQQPPEIIYKQQAEILELKQKIEKLEKQLQFSDVGQNEQALRETNKILNLYKSRLDNEKKSDSVTQEKNAKLIQEYIKLEAQLKLCQQQNTQI